MNKARLKVTLKCNKTCEYCINKSQEYRSKWTKISMVNEVMWKQYRSVVISGGEPLMQKTALYELLKLLDGYDICLYTSYSENDVPHNIIEKLSYLKVGKFEIDRKTSRLPYVGSDNQKFIRLG